MRDRSTIGIDNSTAAVSRAARPACPPFPKMPPAPRWLLTGRPASRSHAPVPAASGDMHTVARSESDSSLHRKSTAELHWHICPPCRLSVCSAVLLAACCAQPLSPSLAAKREPVPSPLHSIPFHIHLLLPRSSSHRAIQILDRAYCRPCVHRSPCTTQDALSAIDHQSSTSVHRPPLIRRLHHACRSSAFLVGVD